MSADDAEGFRLSPQQRRLIGQGGMHGRVRATVIADGDVDEAALRAAVARAVRSHEALATRFVAMREGALPLQVVDEAGSATAIDVRQREGRWYIDLDAPAMCVDAASYETLADDIVAAYAGTTDREDPLQYPDVAEWLNEQLDNASEAAAHWAARQIHSGHSPARLDQPCWATRRLPGVGQALRLLARSEGLPPQAVVLTAWRSALRSMSGGVVPPLGVVRDGRRFSELMTVVGVLEAVAPVALEDMDSATALTAARAVTTELEAATAHLECLPVEQPPMTAGFRWLPQRRDLSAHNATFRLESVEPFEYPFAVLLRACLGGPDLRLDIGAIVGSGWRADLETLADRTARLTARVIDQPTVPLQRHSLLSHAEAEEARRRLNPHRTRAHRRGQVQPATVIERFVTHARAPDDTMVVSGDERLTYGQVTDRSARLAGRLTALGAGPEQVVGIIADASLAWVVAVAAVWRCGSACLSIDSTVPRQRAAAQLAHVGTRVVVVAPGCEVPSDRVTVVPVGSGGEFDHAPLPWLPPHPMQLAYVTFTSGTTGPPKGVGVEHRQLAAYADAVGDLLNLGADMTLAAPAAPSADLGMTAWLCAMHHGARLAILRPEIVRDPALMADAIRRSEVDILKITPSHLAALLDAAGDGVLPRQTIVLGGERLPRELVDRIRRAAPQLHIVNHYGPTETTVGALAHVVPATEVPTGEVPIGQALSCAVALPGGDGPVPPTGFPAELWLAGDGVARGYLGDPRLTADRFRPDPSGDTPGRRAYLTGDLVILNTDGTAVFAGREDDQVKVRGTRVEPSEVERELQAQPGVTAAVVLLVGEGLARRLDAWIVAPSDIQTEVILASIREALPAAMVPSQIHVVAAVPRTASGKPDRAALLALRGTPGPTGRPPEGPVEVAVASILAAVLGAPVQDAHASFFEVGGHSLLATLAIARLRTNLGLIVDVETFFTAPTVAGLAAAASPDTSARIEMLATIDQMSDEDVARALDLFGER